QERLAPTLGFGEGRPGWEAFMRAYYRHATTASRLSDAVITRCLQAAEPFHGRLTVRTIRDGMRIARGELVASGALFEREPATILETFLESQRHGVTLAEGTEEAIRQHVGLLAEHREDPRAARAFRAIMRGKQGVARTVGAMHQLGALKAFIPEF